MGLELFVGKMIDNLQGPTPTDMLARSGNQGRCPSPVEMNTVTIGIANVTGGGWGSWKIPLTDNSIDVLFEQEVRWATSYTPFAEASSLNWDISKPCT